MNNDIKEIINDLQRVADRKCYPEDILGGSIAQEWVDYITNLQEEKDKYKNVIDKIKEKIKEDITFCENDSQGVYDKCNIQIKRMKNYLELLEEVE